MDIVVTTSDQFTILSPANLRTMVAATLQAVVPDLAARDDVVWTVGITVLPPDEVHKLNRTYRQKDKTTDVLSFPLHTSLDDLAPDPEGNIELGDIILNTTELEKKDPDHIAKLCIHSLLHLLGYDHEQDHDWYEMQQLEEKIYTAYTKNPTLCV